MIQLLTDNYVWITCAIAAFAIVAFLVSFVCRHDHRVGSKSRAILAMWCLRWLSLAAAAPFWPLAAPFAIVYGVWQAVRICRSEIRGEVAT